MKRLLIAAALVAVLLFPAPGGAAHNSLPTWQLSIEKTCPGLYQGIAYFRGKTWRLERKMGARVTTASYAEHLVGNCDQVVPFVKRWQTIATKRWAEYKQWKKRLAARPAHYAGWNCITNGAYPGAPHEGNGYNGPYTGPLGMTTPWMGQYPPGRDWVHSPIVEVYKIAEKVMARTGFSYSAMKGQWPNTFPPCARYF